MDWGKLLTGLALAAAAVPGEAQTVAPNRNATSEALILVPLTLTKIADLDFGTVVTSGVSGMISIDASTGARTVAGGVTGLASDAGHRAYFGGGGSPNQQVVVTITAPANLVNANGDTLPVLALTLDGSPIRTIHPTARTFFFGVGGIIMVGANQPEGVYQATFTATANYQ